MSGVTRLGLTPQLVTKANTAGQTVLGGGWWSASTASTGGTYGGWAQVAASLAADSLLVGVHAIGPVSNTSIMGPIVVDVGVGGSGSEVVIGSAVISGIEPQYVNSGSLQLASAGYVPFSVLLRVAAGQRVAVRAQMATVSGSIQTVNVRVLSVPYANTEGN